MHENTPPTLIWFTADDAAVPVENAYLYTMELQRHKVPHALHVFESGRHGLGLSLDNAESKSWPELCAAWLGKHGFR